MSAVWPEERNDEYRRLYADGLSHSHIAAEMGITRNASIGKAHRLGLESRRGKSSAEPAVRQPRRRKIYPRPILSHPEPIADPSADLPPDQSERPLTIMDLENCHCRWPLGTPSVSMLYCADPTADVVNGRPYCGRHAAIAHQPVRSRTEVYWNDSGYGPTRFRTPRRTGRAA